jgi:hypothetical protein
MDVLWGFLLVVTLGVGAWFLAKWAWRAVTWPFRNRGRGSDPRPTGLGAEYETIARLNAEAASSLTPALATTSRVTAAHYDQVLSSGSPRTIRPSTSKRPALSFPALPRESSAPNGAGRGAADRLRELEELRNEGLITEDEYSEKRQEVLGVL